MSRSVTGQPLPHDFASDETFEVSVRLDEQRAVAIDVSRESVTLSALIGPADTGAAEPGAAPSPPFMAHPGGVARAEALERIAQPREQLHDQGRTLDRPAELGLDRRRAVRDLRGIRDLPQV